MFALTAFLTFPGGADKAFADDNVNKTQNVNGKTEIEVGVAVETVDTVSCDIPLYYVLCVTKNADTGRAEVVLPPEDDYYIKNLSGQKNVAVTGLSVSSVAGAAWSLTDTIDNTDRNGKNIHMTVGGVSLPALNAGEQDSKDADVVPKTGENTFYRNGAYQLIGKNTAMTIPVTAQVSKAYQIPDAADGKAAAQFRLAYRISPVDNKGNLLQADYDGPAPTKTSTQAP